MSRRHTKRRRKHTQRGRGVGAVMALLAPVLAKSVYASHRKLSPISVKACLQLEGVADRNLGGINKVS